MLSPGKTHRRLAAAILFLATVLVYIPALNAGFVWDDDRFLWDNELIHSPTGLFSFWFTTLPPDYFPLTSSLLWFEWRLFGMDHPAGYHVVNVLLHATSAILLWRLLHRLAVPGAWFAALLFAVHPVNVEAVAWITQHKSTLPMALSLASALLFFDAAALKKSPAAPKRSEGGSSLAFLRAPRYWLSLFCFLLALLAKTSVVMLPVALLILTWWRNRTLTRRDLLSTLAFFALAAILSLVTIWFQHHVNIAGDVVRDDGFLSRLALSGRAVWFYLFKALLPFNLMFVYPRWEADPSHPAAYLPLALLLLSLIALWRLRARPWARASLAALALFGAMLFPVLGFFDIYFMRYSLVADHWQYSAIPAAIALAVALAAGSPLLRRNPVVLPALASLVAILFSIQTFRLAGDYRDSETLWRATLAKNPAAWIAHQNLGADLLDAGRLDEAIQHFRITLQLEPDTAPAHNNLAGALRDPSQREEALYHQRRALELEPNHAPYWFNMGNFLLRDGQLEQAVTQYRTALNLRPAYTEAHRNLGVALLRQGNWREASRHLETVLKTQPENVGALKNLAWILATCPEDQLRDGNRARDLASRADQLTANHPEILRTLAAAFAETARFEDARKAALRALDLASAGPDPALAAQIAADLEAYNAGTPARDKTTPTPPPLK